MTQDKPNQVSPNQDNPATIVQRIITPPAATVKEPAFLLVIAGDDLGRKYPLPDGELSIGRSGGNHICVDHTSVSRQHAVVINAPQGVRVRDNHSTNGTLVNDFPITEVDLKHGDLIKIGSAVFKFLGSGTVESAYHEELYRQSTLDGLTQLYNKRYFQDALERELAVARRDGKPMSLLAFDIDHFKHCNDNYGHPAGDQVLKQLAGVVRSRARASDIAARTGGEEFCVILHGTDLLRAGLLAEQLRQAVADESFTFEASTIPVTISIGVAEWSAQMSDAGDLVKLADDRLYEAKHHGRNRVVAG